MENGTGKGETMNSLRHAHIGTLITCGDPTCVMACDEQSCVSVRGYMSLLKTADAKRNTSCRVCGIPLHIQPCDNPQCSCGTELLGIHDWTETTGRYIDHGDGYIEYERVRYEQPEFGTCHRCGGNGEIFVCAKCLNIYPLPL